MSITSDYDPIATGEDLWVFGYGSLLWNPGFSFQEAHGARLTGYHRALCIYSHRYRGTPDKPGLVLGLDRGGSCHGLAFRVAHADAPVVRNYLRDREMLNGVYLEGFRRVRLTDGTAVRALCYVADRSHRQYAGHLDREQRLAIARTGAGSAGLNIDYVIKTAQKLRDLGVRDAELDWFAEQLKAS
ncbi:gamma-glutamylcyclotransferase [Agaricicola taiwanensis]|uniref:glutathione-specific gamma-glutamylcyclotransferase n=1 Tax=Agaricicola taiwanensis TaxID=591372 RepID=A0A8J2YLJ1_9RHOB|nr:gamma-glutamylcyclotransferase [Agaricicola taiwanensis]GGE51086.1 gamma-glutamylcyclotransferase [Agaricicola taiwanensis]